MTRAGKTAANAAISALLLYAMRPGVAQSPDAVADGVAEPSSTPENIDPLQRIDSLLGLAEAAMRDGLPSLAWDDATNALALASGAFPERAGRAAFVAGSANERLSPPPERLAWLDSLAASDAAASPAVAWLRARALSALGRHSEAAETLAPLLQADAALPPGVDAGAVARDYAHALAATGRLAEAAAALERATPSDSGSAIDLARLYAASGSPDKAHVVLDSVLESGDTEPEFRVLAALLLAALPDSEVPAAEALSAFETAAVDSLETLPPDLRALSFATRAALVAQAALDGQTADDASDTSAGKFVPQEALALAWSALDAARAADVTLQCRASLLRLLAAADGGESGGEAFEVALDLVSSAVANPVADAAVADAASVRLSSGDPETALRLCDLHISSFPASASELAVQKTRAEALASLGRLEEAATAAQRAAECAELTGDAASRAAALLRAAELLHDAGLDRVAAATLETLLASDPPPSGDIVAAAKLLSAECLAKEDPPAAIAIFTDVARDHAGSPIAAEALFRAGALSAAAEDAQGVEAAPSSPQVAGDIAQTMFKEAAEVPATNAAAFAPLGEEAAASVQAAAALALGQRQQKNGEHEEALQSLLVAAGTPDGGAAAEQAAALLPGAYMALGRMDEAAGACSVFLSRHPRSPWTADVAFWSAARAFDEADWPRAAAEFSAFAEKWQDSDRAGHALRFAAVALFRAGRYEEAASVAGSFAERSPGSPDVTAARFVEAESLARLLRFSEAEPLFARVAASPLSSAQLAAKAALRKADCVYAAAGDSSGKYGEALAAYRAAATMPGADAAGLAVECAFKISRCQEKTGDADGALRTLWAEALAPFEASPTPGGAVWYSRAVFAAADLLRAGGRAGESASLLARLAASGWPGADEAAARISRPLQDAAAAALQR